MRVQDRQRRRQSLAIGGIVLIGVAMALGGGAAPLAAQAQEATVARGRQLFTEKGCYGCHTLGATGTPIAPDLTHAGARYSEATLARWLRHPAAQGATSHMPDLRLNDTEAAALAAYLASLR